MFGGSANEFSDFRQIGSQPGPSSFARWPRPFRVKVKAIVKAKVEASDGGFSWFN